MKLAFSRLDGLNDVKPITTTLMGIASLNPSCEE
jgi:hypothetical protein